MHKTIQFQSVLFAISHLSFLTYWGPWPDCTKKKSLYNPESMDIEVTLATSVIALSLPDLIHVLQLNYMCIPISVSRKFPTEFLRPVNL